MAAAQDIKKDHAPYAANLGDSGSYKDTVTASSPTVEVQVTFKLVGTVSQVQADWNTLKAATITATSSSLDWQ